MNLVVVGGRSHVGSQVITEMLKRNSHVTVMTEDKNLTSGIPTGALGCYGDLTRPDTLVEAFEGNDGLFLATPSTKDEVTIGKNVIDAALEAGIEHIVYLSVHNVEDCPDVPIFKSKVSVEQAIRDSGITFTFLRANHFFQNDLSLKDMILTKNVYNQPFGNIGVNRVDARDVAEAACNAFLEKGHSNKIYPLVGPIPLTGEMIGEIYSRQTGKSIQFTGNNINEWAETTKQVLPSEVVNNLTKMYKHFQKDGLLASTEDLAREKKILGHEPRSFESFVNEMMTPLNR